MAEVLALRHNSDASLTTVVMTSRLDGDMGNHADIGEVEVRRSEICANRWSWLHQVHGPHLVRVGEKPVTGANGDALMSCELDSVLSVQVADCAPVGLIGDRCIGIAHAGWRGLAAGVVGNVVDEMRRWGSESIEAIVGPCISASEYEFGDEDLEDLENRFGPTVRARTVEDKPAFDLRAALASEFDVLGIDKVQLSQECTAVMGDKYYSHRSRRDRQRQVMAIWRQRP